MNYLALRDQLFSDLHVATLKPSGYKKRGHWIVRDLGSLVQSFYLRASRFGNQQEAIFWIDVQVFSADWHKLVFPELPYKGPSEGPCLVSHELGKWCTPPLNTLDLSAGSDVKVMLAQLCSAVEQHALPYLAARQSPESLRAKLLEESEPGTELSIVGLSRLLGDEVSAREHMAHAKQNAVHENHLRFLELRERNIWRNAA
jgi:hypothetical protein